MNLRTAHILRTLVVVTIVTAIIVQAKSGYANTAISDKYFQTDTSRYPLADRYGDPYSNPNRNTFDLRDTGYLKRTIEYDPKTKQYYIIEKSAISFTAPQPPSAWKSF